MKPSQEINDLLAIFFSGMTAVAIRLVRAIEKPSRPVIIGEVLVGLAFCFIIAPAAQERYSLSIKAVCAMTWAGAYFSGLLLQGAERILKGYVEKFTPKPKEEDDDK